MRLKVFPAVSILCLSLPATFLSSSFPPHFLLLISPFPFSFPLSFFFPSFFFHHHFSLPCLLFFSSMMSWRAALFLFMYALPYHSIKWPYSKFWNIEQLHYNGVLSQWWYWLKQIVCVALLLSYFIQHDVLKVNTHCANIRNTLSS